MLLVHCWCLTAQPAFSPATAEPPWTPHSPSTGCQVPARNAQSPHLVSASPWTPRTRNSCLLAEGRQLSNCIPRPTTKVQHPLAGRGTP
ncbi:hypothetical protein V8C86DRAFT_2457709 [Haematococcus lacustris]